MDILYRSTRGDKEIVKSSTAILRGLAPDGGLYVPDHLPRFTRPWREFGDMHYREVAFEVMKMLLTDYTDEELHHCIDSAYDDKFDVPDIAPITCADGDYFLELYHGRTLAFKDMALSVLPHLMTTALRKARDEHEIVILTATSGDTGKAALEAFADVPGTRIIVFYPKHGVSPVQEKQMVTQEGKNVLVVGIEGNFDDAQAGVKALFTDAGLLKRMDEAGFAFSSANSINIGRLVPQVVYYVYAYTRLLKENEIGDNYAINICVPTGNFGNILAAYYAAFMGLPVKKLICASNANRVLYDFFKTGTYDKNREFVLTGSPSMDILVSSNLERLIYHIAGDDAEKNAALMKRLTRDGVYEISRDMRAELSRFHGGYAPESACADAIRYLFDKTGYLVDTHTAVAYAVHKKYKKDTGDDTATVVASTASPFKFARYVDNALNGKSFKDPGRDEDDFALSRRLAQTAEIALPQQIVKLEHAPVLHDHVVDPDGMKAEVKRFLGL